MSNVNTEHSKKLCQQTAAAYQAKLTAANRLEIRNKDGAKITAIKEGLAAMPGTDNAEKLLYLLSLYKKHTK